MAQVTYCPQLTNATPEEYSGGTLFPVRPQHDKFPDVSTARVPAQTIATPVAKPGGMRRPSSGQPAYAQHAKSPLRDTAQI